MKRKFGLLFTLIMALTMIFTINSFTAQATGIPATVCPDQLEVGAALPTKTTRNLLTDENADFGDIYSNYNNTSSRATMTVQQENNENYIAMRAKDNVGSNYILNTSVLTNKIKNGSIVKIKLVFRPTKDFATNGTNNKKMFLLRLDSTKNDIQVGGSYLDTTFDGQTWLTFEKEFTLKADCKYFHFYNYAQPGHGCDIKYIEITYLGSKVPEISTKEYDYDSKSNQDLAVTVDTKEFPVESLFVQGPEDEKMHFVARNAYSMSEDFKTLIIQARWLKTLINGEHTFTVQIEETYYTFTVTVTGYEPPAQEPDVPDTPDTPDTPTDDKGCGSVIGATSALLSTALLAGAVVVLKKKR
ncbi:MAG: hypothetical protein E7342_04540 [Clostridiales bacterium]|nr:hypothetical protein [Clostridiales bacterium]